MGEIAGLPYWEVVFDDNGRPNAGDADTLISGAPGLGVTDLMVFAHGWNNDRGQATSLYRRFFEQVPGLLTGGGPGLGFAGVIWPAKRWADETIPGSAGGAAALADAVGPPADRALVEDLTDVFTTPEQRAALEQLGGLLADRPDDPRALRRFQSLMGELATGEDARPAGEDGGEVAMVSDDPQALFTRFARAVPAPAGEGGAAGIGSPFSRLWDGAKEALRQLTYFEMKKRAGVVGQAGLGPLVGRLAGEVPAAAPGRLLPLRVRRRAAGRPAPRWRAQGHGAPRGRAAGGVVLRPRPGGRQDLPAGLAQLPGRLRRRLGPAVPLGRHGPRRRPGVRRLGAAAGTGRPALPARARQLHQPERRRGDLPGRAAVRRAQRHLPPGGGLGGDQRRRARHGSLIDSPERRAGRATWARPARQCVSGAGASPFELAR